MMFPDMKLFHTGINLCLLLDRVNTRNSFFPDVVVNRITFKSNCRKEFICSFKKRFETQMSKRLRG